MLLIPFIIIAVIFVFVLKIILTMDTIPKNKDLSLVLYRKPYRICVHNLRGNVECSLIK